MRAPVRYPGGRRGTDEGSGEGYLASVADLMVGVLFVFILVLMFFARQFQLSQDMNNQLEQFTKTMNDMRTSLASKDSELDQTRQQLSSSRQEISSTRQELSASRRQLSSLRGQVSGEIDRLDRELRVPVEIRARFLTNVRDRLAKEGIPVTIDEGNGVLRLGDSVLFATLSAELSNTPDPTRPNSPSAREAVSRIAAVMKDKLPCYVVVKDRSQVCDPSETPRPVIDAIFIEGHTDNDPIRSGARYENNHALSTARALSTYMAILSDQPELAGLRNERDEPILSLSGYGPDRPVRKGDGQTDKDANRRIDIRFLLAPPSVEALQDLRNLVRPR